MKSPPTAADPLAAVRNDDGTVNWLKIGQAEQARRTGQAASQDLLDCIGWLHENGGTFYIAQAAERYVEHVRATVRKHGGVIVSEVSRTGSDGRHTVTRTVRRYPPRRLARMAAIIAPRGARRESHRSRPGHRRAASSSTTSATDPGSDGEPPPALRSVGVSYSGVENEVRS